MRRTLHVLIFGAFVTAVFGTASAPVTRAGTVTPFPGTCGSTLQQCINAANAGDTIQVAVNDLTTTDFSLDIHKSLTLEAAPGFSPMTGVIGVADQMSSPPI